MNSEREKLRRGWTTGACAAAAAKAAAHALLFGDFPDPVIITLPGGQKPAFALARYSLGEDSAVAAIVKDAGDDPDVTHGAVVSVKISHGRRGAGIQFHAGPGVGLVTLPGLPVPPGEPAINPKPRKMIAEAIGEVSPGPHDFDVEISVDGGKELTKRTLNPRLGIEGGISILGTTGIVIPYSCAAWIHSIHRGIDVARALEYSHIVGSTGDASEKAAQRFHNFHEQQLIEMGDFIGGMLKYIRTHPVARVTIAGGVAKMTKLAQGMLDVHSKRGRADMNWLASLAEQDGAGDLLVENIKRSNTVAQAFCHAREADFPLGEIIAVKAWGVAALVLGGCQIELEILIFDRDGQLQGHAPCSSVHGISRPRKRR